MLDVDSGGSMGYGRDYRRRLRGQWGVVDIDDVCAGAEYLVRRLKQLESATRKNPRAPDFEGLDLILDTGVDDTGGMVLPALDGCAGDRARSFAAF